jgi:hypothetical protein
MPGGKKGNFFASSKRESGIFFVCYQLSRFLSTAGGDEVGKSGEHCHATIFINTFFIVPQKMKFEE